MQHAAAGDRAFVDEDYKDAIDHYSKVTKAFSAWTLHQHAGSAFSWRRLAHLCLDFAGFGGWGQARGLRILWNI
jgi:hypothetical protein